MLILEQDPVEYTVQDKVKVNITCGHIKQNAHMYTIFTEFVVALVDHSGQLLTATTKVWSVAWIPGPVDDYLPIIDVGP